MGGRRDRDCADGLSRLLGVAVDTGVICLGIDVTVSEPRGALRTGPALIGEAVAAVLRKNEMV